MLNELTLLKPFLEQPEKEFNVREFARLKNISPATASKQLKYFHKSKILSERKDRGFNFYKADLESFYYKDLKKFYNILKIKESGLIEELDKFYLNPTILLFGSVATGLDTDTSDLDLVIISEKTKEFINKIKFEKKLQRPLQIFVVNDLKDLNNKNLINSVLNGIVIQGEIKWN